MEKQRGKTCWIVGAGSFEGLAGRPGPEDLVVAADGGFEYLKKEGVEPDVLMGDFDSLPYTPEHRWLIRHSPEKDDTDMALAVAWAKERGCRRFFLYGGLGGRLDHTLGNIQLLTGLSQEGLEAYLIGEGVILTAITGECLSFSSAARGMISVFSLTESASGVCETGLKYSLENGSLVNTRPLGVSNEFIGQESELSVREGTLLVLWGAQNGIPKRRVSNPCGSGKEAL